MPLYFFNDSAECSFSGIKQVFPCHIIIYCLKVTITYIMNGKKQEMPQKKTSKT